jgi:hypothetical protein
MIVCLAHGRKAIDMKPGLSLDICAFCSIGTLFRVYTFTSNHSSSKFGFGYVGHGSRYT